MIQKAKDDGELACKNGSTLYDGQTVNGEELIHSFNDICYEGIGLRVFELLTRSSVGKKDGLNVNAQNEKKQNVLEAVLEAEDRSELGRCIRFIDADLTKDGINEKILKWIITNAQKETEYEKLKKELIVKEMFKSAENE